MDSSVVKYDDLPEGFTIDASQSVASPAYDDLPEGFVVDSAPAPAAVVPKKPAAAPTYSGEFGKSFAKAAVHGVGDTLRGVSVLTTDDKRKVDEVEQGITNLPNMSSEEATKFFHSIPHDWDINPEAAWNYQSAVQAWSKGDKAGMATSLAEARKYTDTRPLEDQKLYKQGQDINASVDGADYNPAADWKDSWTNMFGQGLGSTVAFLPVGVLSGGTGIAALGAAQSSAQQYDQGQGEMKKVMDGEAPNSYLNKMTPEDAQRQVMRAAKLGAGPGASEVAPIEFLLNGTVKKIPWLKPFANSPMMTKLLKTAGRVVMQAAAEGGQEYGQTVGSNFINQLMLNPDQELTEGAWNNALAGALTGGVMQGGSEALDVAKSTLKSKKGGSPPPSAGPSGPTAGSPPSGPAGERIEPRLVPAPTVQPKAPSPAAPVAAAGKGDLNAVGHPDPETDMLLQSGETEQTIADMHPAERKGALQEAYDAGIRPRPAATSQEGASLAEQILKDNNGDPRKAYLDAQTRLGKIRLDASSGVIFSGLDDGPKRQAEFKRYEEANAILKKGFDSSPSQTSPAVGSAPMAPRPPKPEVADNPTAEPISDIKAQLADMQKPDSTRYGVFLSADALAHAGDQVEGGFPVKNFDGKGGTLIARDRAIARKAVQARNSGVPMQEILGALTGAGVGKPADASAVVQQLDDQGNVVRESVVNDTTRAQTEQDFTRDGHTVQTVPMEQAIKRREDGVQADQRVPAPMAPRTVKASPVPVQKPLTEQTTSVSAKPNSVTIAAKDQLEAPSNPVNDENQPKFTSEDKSYLQSFEPSQLKTAAKVFQYKEGGDESGVTGVLKDVEKWNDAQSGVSIIWQSKSGENYVANGHQRHGLAVRAEAAGQKPKIVGRVYREADGFSAHDAMIIAANVNMGEGTGTALDAAKIFKTKPSAAENLPQNAIVRDGKGLAKLSDEAFGMVVNKKVDPSYAAIVGRLAADAKTHTELMGILAKSQPDNAIEAESIVRDAMQAPVIQENMVDLFGSSEQTQILFKERAQILSAASTAIKKDRAAFTTLVKEAIRITGAGNKLVTDKNAQRATEDANLLATLQATARRKGPVADALAIAAKQLHEGASLRSANEGFLDALRGKVAIPAKPSAQNLEHGHEAKPRVEAEKPKVEQAPVAGPEPEVKLAKSEPAKAEAETKPIPRAASRNPNAPPAAKIADFGQKIEGARKDAVRDIVASLSGDVDIATEPLSKTFPQPDFAKMAEAGVDTKALALVAVMRSEIPTKPQKKWKVESWVQKVKMLRDFASKLLSGTQTFDAVSEKIADPRFKALATISDTAKVIAGVAPESLPFAAKFRVKAGYFTMLNGKEFDGRTVQYYLVDENDRMTKIQADSLEEIIKPAREFIDAAIAKQDGVAPTAKKTPVAIYQDRKSKEYFLGFKASGGVIRLKTGFTSFKEASIYRAENATEVQNKIDELRKGPAERRSSNMPRTGAAHREGDVTPEQFNDVFGFRGVQFGNYVESDRRQSDLNDSFDALMDLADALGIPPRAISLDGQLGLAFGARGSGKYSAHYEPSQIVINLTKTKGAGSLAHEWLHALDNYFAKQDSGSEAASGAYISDKKTSGGKTRDVVFRAWKGVEKAITQGAFFARAKEFDAARSKPYFSTTIELAARSFERYVHDRLASKNATNDYLANINEAGGAYPTETEMQEQGIKQAYDDLFKAVEVQDGKSGPQARLASVSELEQRFQAKAAEEVKPIREALKIAAQSFGYKIVDTGLPFGAKDHWGKFHSFGTQLIDRLYPGDKLHLALDKMSVAEPAVKAYIKEHMTAPWFHRVWFGHDPLANFGMIVDKFGVGSLPTYFGGLLKDSMSKAGIPLPGVQWLVQGGLVGDKFATKWLSLNIGEALAGGLSILGTYKLYKKAKSGKDIHRGWAMTGILFKVVGGTLSSNPVVLMSAAADTVILMRAQSIKQGFKEAIRIEPRLFADKKDQAPLASVARPQSTFYSGLIRAAENIKQEKASPNQWLGMIRNAQGVKPEEMAWVGLEDWIKEQSGPVTKAQLLDFLNSNQVQVQEVVKGAAENTKPITTVEDAIQYLKDEKISSDPENDWGYDNRDEYISLANSYQSSKEPTLTKFSSYQLAGGSNYRELLLTLPRKPEFEKKFKDGTWAVQGHEGSEVIYGATRDEALSRFQKSRGNGNEFQSSHWNEPNILAHVRFNERTTEATPTPEQKVNIARKAEIEVQAAKLQKHIAMLSKDGGKEAEIAMQPQADELRALWKSGEISAGELARRSDKLWADNLEARKGRPAFGNMLKLQREQDALMNEAAALDLPKKVKTLFIEEVQSDMHQQGRKKGYITKSRDVAAMREDVQKIGDAKLKPEFLASYLVHNGKFDPSGLLLRDIQHWQTEGVFTPVEALSMRNYVDARDHLNIGVPDAPFKTTWQELAFKRMLRYAAENNFDSISWTTGDVQNERYDLSKQVSRITWNKKPDGAQDGKIYVAVHKDDRGGEPVMKGMWSPDEIADNVGKDIADKIVNGGSYGTLEGLDLKLGGSGMKGFYDKILVDTANKLGKKFGAKVGQTDIGNDSNRLRKAQDRYDNGDINEDFLNRIKKEEQANGGTRLVHSLPITEAMRDSVMQGQPLFKQGDATNFLTHAPLETRKRIAKNIQLLADQILGHRIKVSLTDRIEDYDGTTTTAGTYDPNDREILIALKTSLDAIETLGHESLHALRDLGVFTKGEWTMLKSDAARIKIDGVPIMDEVRKSYDAMYRKAMDLTEAQHQDLLAEEAVAHMIGLHVAGKVKVRNGVAGVIDRVMRFLEALRNMAKGYGFKTGQGVVDDILSGEMKDRAGTEGPGRGYYLNRRGANAQEELAQAANDASKSAAFSRWFGDSKVVDAEGKPLVVYHGTGNAENMERFDPLLTGQGNDQLGSGFYFTTVPETASGYTTSTVNSLPKLGGDTTPGIVPVYLSIKNPLRVNGSNLTDTSVNLTVSQAEKLMRKSPKLKDIDDSPIGNWHDVSDNEGISESRIRDVSKHYKGQTLILLENDFFKGNAPEFRRALHDVLGYDGVVQTFSETGEQHWVAWFPTQIKSIFNRGNFDPNDSAILAQLPLTDDGMFPTESGADNKPQTIIPGAEKISDAKRAQMAADAKLKAKVEQKPMEDGLFGDGHKQGSLFHKALPPRNPKDGTFDMPHDERVLQALADSTDSLLGRIRRGAKAFGLATRRSFQDREVDLKRTQAAITAAGRNIPETQDAYLAASLYPGRSAQKDEDFVTDVVEPLIADIHKAGLTLEDVDQFNKARHALERNLALGKLYGAGDPFFEAMTDPSIVGASGFSENQVNQILDGFERSGKYSSLERIGDRIIKMNRDTINSLYNEGLISEDQLNAMVGQYKYYVPLRGYDSPLDNSGPDSPRTGKRYDIRGNEIRAAFGRTSQADSSTAYSIMQAREAMVRIEKNKVGKTFLKLVNVNPNEALWQVDRQDTQKIVDKTSGLVKEVPDTSIQRAENDFAVKVGGKTYHITIYHEGLARALKGLGGENMNDIVKIMGTVLRFKSMLHTAYDFEFIMRNLIKDVGEGAFNLQEEQIKGIATKVVSSIPSAIRGMNQMLLGNTNTKWSQMAREFADAGGKIGFINRGDIETEKANLQKLMREMDPSIPLATKMALRDQVFGRINRWNDSVENGIRLSTYVHLREAGYSSSKAAFKARELTVNFNRKGENSSNVNAFYMFFNARVQGTANMIMRLYRSPLMRKIALGIMAEAVVQGLLNHWVAGDDDDGENRYDKIDDSVKKNQFIMMFPKDFAEQTGIPYLHLPLPHSMGLFHGAGTQIAEMLTGSRSPTEVAANIASSVANAFNPVGSGSFLAGIAPTLLSPFVDMWKNKDYFGKDIVPEDYTKKKPMSERFKHNVNPIAKDIAQGANSLTGGNEVRPGGIDVSPNQVQYMWEFMTGGVGKLFSRFGSVAGQASRDEPVDMSQVPFVRTVIDSKSTYADRDQYYEIKKTVQMFKDEVKMFKENRDTQGLAKTQRDHLRERSVMMLVDDAERDIKQINKRMKDVDAVESLSQPERRARINALMKHKDAAMLRVRKAWNNFGKK